MIPPASHPWEDRLISSRASRVFSRLDAPAVPIHQQPRAGIRLLPACCGTYAFYDAFDDVLYVGKANNARARIRSHFAPAKPDGLLSDWTRKVKRIEVRVAHSELEALLVEAALVGHLRPAFNRQMRSWRRYCYLVRNDSTLNPWSVSTQACAWRPCFGPYRSRRQAVAIIEAFFHVMRLNSFAAPPLDAFPHLLTGRDDALMREVESRLEAVDPSDDGLNLPLLRKVVATLRNAHARGSLLRDARRLLGGLLVLPGPEDTRTIAYVSAQGLHLRSLRPEIASAELLLSGYESAMQATGLEPARCLPKAIADILCVAAQHGRRRPKACPRIAADVAIGLAPPELLSMLEQNPKAD